jgi:osmotically-inducible protein OsmY
LPEWIEAHDQGKIKISGEGGMVKLVGKVIEKQQRRHGG